MGNGEENVSFLSYILGAELRFLQERTVGLDLYHSGFLGVLVFCWAVASATVFLLALFQVLPRRRHVTGLLLGLGALALCCGLTSSFLNFHALPVAAGEIIRDSAGNPPVTREQEAAVIALPLLAGAATLSANALGCLYLALFWAIR